MADYFTLRLFFERKLLEFYARRGWTNLAVGKYRPVFDERRGYLSPVIVGYQEIDLRNSVGVNKWMKS